MASPLVERSISPVNFPVIGVGRPAELAKSYDLCYYNTMRNMKTPVLQRHVAALKASGMLTHTQSQNRNAGEAIEPVPYFVIPAEAARRQGVATIVSSFVHLDGRGILSLTAPKAYGVVERPTQAVVAHASLRLREAHVIAEDMALRRGIYTPYGRAAAEIFVAKMVAEDGNAETYVPDRITHLTALSEQVSREGEFRRPDEIVAQLDLGMVALENYLNDL